MALIRFGGGVSEIRGSIAGNTFSRNKSGAIARNRIKGVNPRSIAQGAARALFGYLQQTWRNLTSTQRTSWNQAAPDFPIQNKLGETVTLSGQQLYSRLNNNILAAGGNILTNAPEPEGFPAPADVVVDFDSTDDTLNVTPPYTTSSFGIILEMTGILSPGKTNVTNRYRQVAVFPGDDVPAGADLLEAWQAKFGIEETPATGNNIRYRIYGVNLDTGERSVAFQGAATYTTV